MGYPLRTTRKTNRLTNAVSPVLEYLEARQLLSAATLDDGVLTIHGTEQADTIVVTTATQFEGRLKVSVNKQVSMFDLDAVKKIVVHAYAGDDYVTIEAKSDFAIPAWIDGGAGNDTLSGAAGDDTIYGGEGDDFIVGKAGNDLLFGGDGNDRILGGEGDDTIYGNKGNDLISTEPDPSKKTNDQVFAGPGKNQVNAQFKPNFPIFTYTPEPSGYSVEQMRRAYGFGDLNDKTYTNRGKGQAIAIITAYHAPTARRDLATFSREFKLPLPTAKNFIQVSANKQRLTTEEGWAGEAMLDIQWARAIAPAATIILVEAASPLHPDIAQAVDVAVGILNRRFRGGVVSMSLGSVESSISTFTDGTFAKTNPNNKHITFVAAAGDDPWPSHPATHPNVTAVGGTKLFLDAYGNRLGGDVIAEVDEASGDPIMYHDSEVSTPNPYPIFGGERPWWSAGSGPSALYNTPRYQQSRGVGPERGTPDIAWNADPASGVSVYNSFGDSGGSGWAVVGGTSAGAPQFAALVALANQVRAQNKLPKIGSTLQDRIYRLGNRGPDAYMNDITQLGVLPLTLPMIPHPWNGPYLYPATPGWDYASGFGSPNARSLIPALADQRPTLLNSTFNITGRLSRYDPAATGATLSTLSFRGNGRTQGYTALGTTVNVRQVFETDPTQAATTTLTMFGFNNIGVAMPGNPILWHRDGNTIVGFGKYQLTTTTTTQPGTPGQPGEPTAAVERGFVKFVGTAKGNKISGKFFTANPDGTPMKNVLRWDPADPMATRVLFSGTFKT